MAIIDLERLASAKTFDAPYRHFFGEELLRAGSAEALQRDYPKLKNAGYLTLREIDPVGTFAEFLEELQGREVSAAVSERLQFDLVSRPKLVTVMRWSPLRAGRIHTDGKSKLATMLVYFNSEWTAGSAGAIRVLNGPNDMNDMAAEVAPLSGNFFGFLRSDNSWHGHLPYQGERKVVQITWLESEEAVDRKRRNNAFAQSLKSMWPFGGAHGRAGEPHAVAAE